MSKVSRARAAASNSSERVTLSDKIIYNFKLLIMRLATDNGGAKNAFRRIEEMKRLARRYEEKTGRLAANSTITEIGFGARPERAFAMTAFFGKVTAIDLDSPMLSLRDVVAIFRKNGLERALKSAVRHAFFDARGWKAFHKAFRQEVPAYDPSSVAFIVGNAGDRSTWKAAPRSDLIFSQDVFEHVGTDDLRALLREIKNNLKEDGLLITVPCVYTGIIGGHDVDWYSHLVESNNKPEGAWRHLTDKNFRVNTYLNRLSRREYCNIFREAGFRIVRDEARDGEIGRKFLTAEKRKDLADYDAYELFSNNVEFWLEPI